MERLAHTSGEHLELSSNDGRAPKAGQNGTNHASLQFSSPPVVYNEEFDASVAMFNIVCLSPQDIASSSTRLIIFLSTYLLTFHAHI